MALRNDMGMAISYDAEDLIWELKQDLYDYGPVLKVKVITEMRCGVKIYKDYMIDDDDESATFEDLQEGETVELISARKLLDLYIQENSIF